MCRILSCIALLAVMTQVLTGCVTFTPAPPFETEVKIQFINYIQSGAPEQDVFIEPDGTRKNTSALPERCKSGTGVDTNFVPVWMLPPPWLDPCVAIPEVVRPAPEDAQRPVFLAKQVYAAKHVIPHDLHRLGPIPLGPFPKGDALGMTWGEWLAAQGDGTYVVKEGSAELNLSFHNLIPHGAYSLWCGEQTPSYETFIEAPCGNSKGSQNQISADEWGNASLSIQLKPLPASTQGAATILSLSYDRVAPVADEGLGGYGLNNHVQLHFKFPSLPVHMSRPAY